MTIKEIFDTMDDGPALKSSAEVQQCHWDVFSKRSARSGIKKW